MCKQRKATSSPAHERPHVPRKHTGGHRYRPHRIKEALDEIGLSSCVQITLGPDNRDPGVRSRRPIRAAEKEDGPKLPAIKPLFDYPVRDTCVCLGPGWTYYLTGTTGHPTWWQTNEGIRVWKSKDLKAWEPLGLVWSFEKDATWQKAKDGKRAIWAPELHYFKGTFWIAYCVNYGGTGILRSKTGKAEGPYEDVKPGRPTDRRDRRLAVRR